MGISGENPAAIRKSGPEIKNRCTLKGISGENLASIRKSGPEIKNRSSSKPVLQAKPFSVAANKIRIGRVRSQPRRPQQAKQFFCDATKIRI